METDRAEPGPRSTASVAKAVERRTRGAQGCICQSRFPNEGWETVVTAAPYSVFQELRRTVREFRPWLPKFPPAAVHGHLFAPAACICR